MTEPRERLRSIFERLRAEHYPTLPSEVVDRLADIENDYLFTADVVDRRREVRRLIEMYVREAEVAQAAEAAQAREEREP